MKKKILKPKKTAKTKLNRKKTVKASRPKKTQEQALTQNFGLHNLEIPYGAHQRKRILGRGPSSGHGKTSTRGSKGQTSRSGRATYPGFEGGQMPLIRRMPKRGFTSKFKKEYQIVNLGALNRIKETTVTPELLKEKGLIKNKEKPVKILGGGPELKAPVTIHAHAFSSSALEKIKNAAGQAEIINA